MGFLCAAVLGAWACSINIGVVLMFYDGDPVGRLGIGYDCLLFEMFGFRFDDCGLF